MWRLIITPVIRSPAILAVPTACPSADAANENPGAATAEKRIIDLRVGDELFHQGKRYRISDGVAFHEAWLAGELGRDASGGGYLVRQQYDDKQEGVNVAEAAKSR